MKVWEIIQLVHSILTSMGFYSFSSRSNQDWCVPAQSFDPTELQFESRLQLVRRLKKTITAVNRIRMPIFQKRCIYMKNNF